MATISLDELHKHQPVMNTRGQIAACYCGWKAERTEEQRWLAFIEHLPGWPAPAFGLTCSDRAFLQKCKIRD